MPIGGGVPEPHALYAQRMGFARPTRHLRNSPRGPIYLLRSLDRGRLSTFETDAELVRIGKTRFLNVARSTSG